MINEKKLEELRGVVLEDKPSLRPVPDQWQIFKECFDTIEALWKLVPAAKAAVNHLRACEKGEIGHPFKSASLPMLEKALAPFQENQ